MSLSIINLLPTEAAQYSPACVVCTCMEQPYTRRFKFCWEISMFDIAQASIAKGNLTDTCWVNMEISSINTLKFVNCFRFQVMPINSKLQSV